MKEIIDTYLENLNLSTQIKDRVSLIYLLLTRIVKDEIKDIFLSDYLQGNNNRVFQNIYFFTDTNIIVVQNFQTMNEFFITKIKNSILYARISNQEYDFESSNENSQLSVIVSIIGDSSGDFAFFNNLRASGKNCEYLRRILDKYFLKNFLT